MEKYKKISDLKKTQQVWWGRSGKSSAPFCLCLSQLFNKMPDITYSILIAAHLQKKKKKIFPVSLRIFILFFFKLQQAGP